MQLGAGRSTASATLYPVLAAMRNHENGAVQAHPQDQEVAYANERDITHFHSHSTQGAHFCSCLAVVQHTTVFLVA